MEWHELRDALAKDRRLAHEKQPEYGYARISIDLGDAEYVGTDISLAFSGDQLAKIKYTGSNTGTYFRLNNRHAQQIFASEFKRSNIPFTKIYLTNPTAQVGKTLDFYIGTGIFAAIQPSTIGGAGGANTGITRSDGTVINPAEGHAEDVAHVSGDRGVMPLAVRQDALAVLAAAGDYIPLVVNASGELWVFDEQNKIDGGGDLQKVKEELESVNIHLSTAGAGELNEIDNVLDDLLADYRAVNHKLTVAMGRGLTLTGTCGIPTRGNDNLYVDVVSWDTDAKDLVFTFTKPVLMKQWRQYGDDVLNQAGDGRFDIYYWDEAINNYVLWKSQAAVRGTADWSDWEEVSMVSALKIKIVANPHDSNHPSGSGIREIEFKY